MPLLDRDISDDEFDDRNDGAGTWSLDDLDRPADLGSLRAARAVSGDRSDG